MVDQGGDCETEYDSGALLPQLFAWHSRRCKGADFPGRRRAVVKGWPDAEPLQHAIAERRHGRNAARFIQAIFVVEDDARNGVEHAGGHRATALAISLYFNLNPAVGTAVSGPSS